MYLAFLRGYMMDEDEHNVTFLYKLTKGICEKSFGMNVARMANIPSSVVDRADEIAQQVEVSHRMKDTTFTKSLTPAVMSDLKYLMNNHHRDARDAATRRIVNSFMHIKT